MVEYAHLVVRLDLRDAMAEVKGACQNIRQTAEHCRQHSEGMDIDELMLRQDDLCETYLRQLQNQVYALGSEVKVRGMDSFTTCLLYTSPSPRDLSTSRMPSSA